MLLDKRISVYDFLLQIRLDIFIIICYSILISLAYRFGLFVNISVPINVTAIVGTAVSLLLAFRTAQAYDRWWEARIVWGAIVNDSRTLVRQVKQFVPDSVQGRIDVSDFAYRQIIWCYALGESLRQVPFTDKVQQYIAKHHITGSNIPNSILNRHSEHLATLPIGEFKQVQIDTTLSRLCDAMGMCERIKKTIFPSSYSLLIHFFIYVFTTLLPFGIADTYFIVEISVTVIIPIIFIAIEKTAIILQNPFDNMPTDTPVTSIATTIETNLKELIGDPDIPAPKEVTTYYVM